MIIPLVYKAIRKILELILVPIFTPIAYLLFYLNGAEVQGGLVVRGFAKVIVTRRGRLLVGRNMKINSGDNYNIIGRQQKCIFWVEGILNIGDNVGMSATALICKNKITIGNNVMIGGGTVIYDTDFHSIDFRLRSDNASDMKAAKVGAVTIGNNVFIGAHVTILKGVTVGDNAVIGACSVVAKNVPSNEVWAGNPAKFIKSIEL